MARQRGQPTKYKQEYWKILLEMMSKGKSVIQFCAKIGICRDTFYEWTNKHTEFSDTYKKAVELCESYWEDIGKRGILGLPVKDDGGNDCKINTGMYVFYMKNRFHWTDRLEQSMDINASGNIDISSMSIDERQKRMEELVRKLLEKTNGPVKLD
jgi:ACT domain-containing protein